MQLSRPRVPVLLDHLRLLLDERGCMKTNRLLLAGFAGLYYYAAATLYLTPDTLYIGHDGECIIESIKLLFDYAATPLDLSVFSPVEGLGTMIQPVGVWLHPGCWPFGIFADDLTAKLASCVIVVIFVSLSSYWLGRVLELPPLLSLLTAQCTAVLFFPPLAALFFEPFSLSHLYALWPFLGITTSLSNLFLIAVLRISRETTRYRLIGSTLALPAIVLYAILTDPLHTPVLFIPAGVVSVCVILASADRTTFWRRSLASAACLITLLACGVPGYYEAISGYAARQVFPQEIGGEIQQFDRFVAFLLQNTSTGGAVVLLIAGCCGVIYFGSRQQRGFGAAVLVVLGLVLAASLYYVYGGVAWNRPPPSYFEHGAVPSYGVALSLGGWLAVRRGLQTGSGSRLGDWLTAKIEPHSQSLGFATALLVPGAAGAFLVTTASGNAPTPALPTQPGPILQQLIDDLAISPGEPFAGSVATLVAVPGGPVARQYEVPDEAPFSEELINLRTDYLRIAPHSLYQAALWRHKIPTLEQYNTLATTPMYFLFSRALSRSHDYQMKNFVLVTESRPGLLACLGCRFLITDREFSDRRLTLRKRETNAFGIVFRLYELAAPNLGQYSPTNIRRVAAAPQAIEQMSADEFPFQEDVFVFEEVDGAGLRPAENVQLAFEPGGVHLEAHSRGQSLLVLPLQFSNTLQIVPRGTSGTVRLLRANVVQTGVLFTGGINITISDNFGLFHTRGRLRDIAECRRLNMVETGEVNYPDHFLPYSRRD